MEKPDKPLKTAINRFNPKWRFIGQRLKLANFLADFINYAAELGQTTPEMGLLGPKPLPKKMTSVIDFLWILDEIH